MTRNAWLLCLFAPLMACAQPDSEPAAAVDVNAKSIHPSCLPGTTATSKQVTHYYVPLLEKYDHFSCDQMEGTCIYKKDGEQWLHNYGYQDQKLKHARCKNGYGNSSNCLNPCRTIAASMRHHKWGEILFIKDLVGMKCGSQRDGTEITHDGFVMVGDTGAQSHFNTTGRFDFFWGRCKNKSNGVCHEGATTLSDAATTATYCKLWNPSEPNKNAALRLEFFRKVRLEAINRGDAGAADEMNY